MAVTLGALMDDLCIVGGLVPSLLNDQQIGPDPETGDSHPGTNDLDVGLAISLLNQRQYEIVRDAMRSLARDFGTVDGHGPRRAAAFEGGESENLQASAADAFGYVDDLLRACQTRG